MITSYKTYSMKSAEIVKDWFIIDASNLVLGRLASIISMRLRGKHNPKYTPHMDCGDNIVVINADKIALTGNKADRKDGKIYYHHTGYMGGIKETTAGKILEGPYKERVLKLAVQRMISRNNKIGRHQLSHLYIYSGSEHPHTAQQPKPLDIAAMNQKNSKSGS